MRSSAGLGPAAAYKTAISNDNAAHCGVWPDTAKTPLRQGKRRPHPTQVGGHCLILVRKFGTQLSHKVLKIVSFLKILVDRSKADIGDGVDPRQRFHHDFTNAFRPNVTVAHAFKPAHNARNHLIYAFAFYRAFL
jgi:hypothetical protein